MPGAVSNSSTFALTNATFPYAKRFVDEGVENALRKDPALALGVNTYGGFVTHPAVAEALGERYRHLSELLSNVRH